jgi:hypothetical protein
VCTVSAFYWVGAQELFIPWLLCYPGISSGTNTVHAKKMKLLCATSLGFLLLGAVHAADEGGFQVSTPNHYITYRNDNDAEPIIAYDNQNDNDATPYDNAVHATPMYEIHASDDDANGHEGGTPFDSTIYEEKAVKESLSSPQHQHHNLISIAGAATGTCLVLIAAAVLVTKRTRANLTPTGTTAEGTAAELVVTCL